MNLPSTQSQASFNRFAQAIGQALLAYPGVLRWTVTKGSVNTFVSRFREAKRAGLRYGYTHPLVNKTLFTQLGEQLTISPREGYVLIGTVEAIKSYDSHPALHTQPDNDSIEVDLSDIFCADYLCILIREKVFKKPVAFTVGPLTQTQATKLEVDYGVTLTPIEDKPGCFTLL